MALYHRKLIFPLKNHPDSETKSSSDCYLCYVCPDHCYVSPPPPLSFPSDQRKTHVSTVLILMLCILGVAFIILSYLTVARYRFRSTRRRNSEALEISRADFLDENQGPVLDHPIWYIRTVGFPQSLIDSIASFTFKKGDGLIEGNDCSICLSDFEENEVLRLLPKCSHAFHVACIDTWLRSHKNCPVCRAPIVIATNASNESSSSSLRSSEENQGEVESREIRSGIERMVIEEERGVFDERNRRVRVVSDLGDHREKVDQELYVLRRSVSMDFSSIIYNEKKGEGNMEMTGRSECKNSSICRMIKSSSLQNRPVSMKRSFSFSGKRSVRKNSRSLESIQLP